MDKIAGHLEVGTNGRGEVVINHPALDVDADGVGHIVFSPKQARTLAATLSKKALEAERETATRSATILIPDAPMMVDPGKEAGVTLFARPGDRPFKITGAERVEGIDYDAFACPGFFLGSSNFPALDFTKPMANGWGYEMGEWPVLMMFSDFKWPGDAVTGFPGQVNFFFRLVNRSDRPQPFAIKLVGLELP